MSTPVHRYDPVVTPGRSKTPGRQSATTPSRQYSSVSTENGRKATPKRARNGGTTPAANTSFTRSTPNRDHQLPSNSTAEVNTTQFHLADPQMVNDDMESAGIEIYSHMIKLRKWNDSLDQYMTVARELEPNDYNQAAHREKTQKELRDRINKFLHDYRHYDIK
uniref:Uncharacterized protein n=1 Tax=Acrobeloides nanus TaxID=290746 RepID=A0A914D1H4_9BILA